MGGAYERLIRIVKEAFRITFHRQNLTDRQFQIATAIIAAILNSRPLTYIGKDINEDVITPNSLLRSYSPSLPPTDGLIASTSTANVVKQARLKASKILNKFWLKFRELYLQALRDRHATLKQRRSTHHAVPEPGQIVMVADDNVKRGFWKLAEVINPIPSADGEVRSADIRLPNNNTTIRPIMKLIPLELHIDVEEEQEDFEIVEISVEELSESDNDGQ